MFSSVASLRFTCNFSNSPPFSVFNFFSSSFAISYVCLTTSSLIISISFIFSVVVFKTVRPSLYFSVNLCCNSFLFNSIYSKNSLSILTHVALYFSFNWLWNPKKCAITNCFKALTNMCDVVLKSLYSFISTIEEIIFITSICT